MTLPNILLITADQFRADSMSGAGHPLVKTPHLDRLAEEGVRFAQHYSQCPPCGPSRTSLLTGMYQMNHRSVQNGTPLDGAFTNLAELVRSVAYLPWLIGYTDTAMDPRRFHPKDPRAGRYEELLPGILSYAPGSELGTGDTDWRFRLKELGYENWNKPYRQNPKRVDSERPTFAPIEIKAEHSDTAYTADRAMRFFRQNDVEQPWFLHVSFLRPHPPFVASEPYHAMYDLEDVPDFRALRSLDDERAIHPYMPFRLERLEMNPKLPMDIDHPNNSPAWRQARATYYGLITELDHHIGRMMAALKELGVYDNTLIVFTSDHAEMLGDHWCWGKETLFDAAVRTPLIVKSPMVSAGARGRVVEAFTEHVDVTPTILDHVGVEVPLQCDGRSLRPFLEGGQPAKWRDAAHWDFDFRNINDESVDGRFGISIDECCLAVVRTSKQKYVHFAGLPPLYYDIADDPAELNNLSGQPAHAAAERDMARRMLNWRIAFNRRELTGIRLQDGTQIHAARARRIV
jgi:arylsulfatase A-like enzyme